MAKNQLDSMVYNVEKMLRENGDKISGSDKSDLESALNDAKSVLETGSAAELNAAREKLTQASHKLAEAMYKAQSAQGAGGVDTPGAAGTGATSEPKKDEGVIDAEYVDVDERK